MKNFLLSFLIVVAAFAAGRYLFPDGADTRSDKSDVLVRTSSDFETADMPNSPGRSAVSERSGGRPTSPGESPTTTYTDQELHTIRLFEDASPSVCYITTKALQRDFWSYSTREVESGSGSGFVWDREGHIITNFHVIRGASSALVTLGDGSAFEATVIGTAPEKDLAVLKIRANPNELRPIDKGNSYNIRVGQAVYAIGNPFGLDRTLTSGIVSALDREIKSQAGVPIKGAIQSDAAINPGNSGGPLLDSQGKLIGVNTAIYSPSGASAGIGFSIPVDVVKYVVPDLIAYGEVRRASLGIDLRQFAQVKGLVVISVAQDGPAGRGGVRGLSRDSQGRRVLGDVLVGINGKAVGSSTDLYLELEKYDPGEFVKLDLIRDERRVEVEVELGSSID